MKILYTISLVIMVMVKDHFQNFFTMIYFFLYYLVLCLFVFFKNNFYGIKILILMRDIEINIRRFLFFIVKRKYWQLLIFGVTRQ